MANIISENKPNGSSFVVGDFIEKGSFSKVYSLQCCTTRNQFAGKFISKEKLEKYGIYNKVWSEINIHKELRHPNIVQFLTYIEQEKDIVIVLEYCSRYSMAHVLNGLKILTLSESKYFMEQIILAVEYLHKKHIVHRDLKLGNLFVDKNLMLKLGDFGLAVNIEHEGQKRFSRCGTPNYLAPEVINGVGHSYEVDVWALGCILHTMLEGKPPFQAESTTSTYNNILKCIYGFSSGTDCTAKTFITSCLQPDPLQRPSVSQLLQFEFITSTNIVPKAPKFVFSESEVLSFYKKRLRLSKPNSPKHVLPISEPVDKDLPKHHFQVLFRSLRHVKKWSDSNFGEFLAEHNSAIPLVWVNSWMDYSNSYGFAYQLSNNDYGIIFNDNTRMHFQRQEGSIRYCQNNESSLVFQKGSIPDALRKKFKVLSSCQSYMDKSLVKAHEAMVAEPTDKVSSPAEVFKWTRGEKEMVIYLTNGSVQVNFYKDHTKLILCGFTKTATVIESAKFMKTLKLDSLQHCGCSKILKGKLYFALKHLYNFLKDEDK